MVDSSYQLGTWYMLARTVVCIGEFVHTKTVLSPVILMNILWPAHRGSFVVVYPCHVVFIFPVVHH